MTVNVPKDAGILSPRAAVPPFTYCPGHQLTVSLEAAELVRGCDSSTSL